MQESSPISNKNLSVLLNSDTRLEIMSDKFRKIHFALEQERLQPDDFTDVYPAETIMAARQAVRDFINLPGFERNNDEIGQVGEDIMHLLCFEEGGIEGVDQIFTTSRFDDYLRGIDIVLKFVPDAYQERDKKAVYLGIDVKTTLDVGSVEDKIRSIEDRLEHPEESNIEFFRDNSELVDDQTRAKYANVLPSKKKKIDKLTAEPTISEGQSLKPLEGRLSLPRIVLHLDPKLCTAMEKILVKSEDQRTAQEKEDVKFTKLLLNLNLLNQLFAFDLYFDLENLSSPNHKLLQKQYQEAIVAVLENLDLGHLLEELDQLIKQLLSMKNPPKETLRDLETKKSDIMEYIETRKLEI